MNARYFLFIVFFVPFVTAAQYNSNNVAFQVDEKSGCAPFTVNIIRTDLDPLRQPCSALNPCFITWGDGVSNQNVFSHTYTTPGTYTLDVNYQTTGPDQIQITVYPNVQPVFEVYRCSGNEVQVRVTDTNYDAYIINYNDGSPEVTIPKGSSAISHTFATPGSKTISVRGRNTASADNCTPAASKTVIVSVAAPPVPTISQVVITSNSVIDLQFITQQNVLYRLEFSINGGPFNNLGNLLDVNTATAPNLDTDANYYCFRLGTVDPCTGGITFSPTVCSVDLAVTAQNNANQLTWVTALAGITNFTIQRDGVTVATTAATAYSDPDVTCGTEYCYQVIANYGASSTSYSTSRCVTAISTDVPTAIADVTAVVAGETVELTWQPDAVFNAETFRVLRQSNGGSFSSLQSGLVFPAFTDDSYTTSGQFCYQIDYIDNCANASNPGIVSCPMILRYTTNTDNEIILTWTAYTGWTAGVAQYELDKYDLNRSLLTTISTGTSTSYTDNDLTDQGYYYVVRAIPNNTINDESVSNEVKALRRLVFAYPKAFTPDKQGPEANETFKVFVTEEFIDAFDMKIFNRWGELIFSTTDLLKGWDGKFNGEPQPEGTYTFTATLRDKTGRVFRRDGSVLLLRKK